MFKEKLQRIQETESRAAAAVKKAESKAANIVAKAADSAATIGQQAQLEAATKRDEVLRASDEEIGRETAAIAATRRNEIKDLRLKAAKRLDLAAAEIVRRVTGASKEV